MYGRHNKVCDSEWLVRLHCFRLITLLGALAIYGFLSERMVLLRVVGEERDGALERLVSYYSFCIAPFVWSKCRSLSPWEEK